jgi:hypothetical protein
MLRALAPLVGAPWRDGDHRTMAHPPRKRPRTKPFLSKKSNALQSRASSQPVRAHHDVLLKALVSEDLSEMRFEREFDDCDVAYLKQSAQRWLDAIVDASPNKLRPFLREDADNEGIKAALRKDMFEGLETKHLELSFLAERIDSVAPRKVALEDGSEVISFDIFDLLVQRLQQDKSFRQKIIATSDEWKSGAGYQTTPAVRRDITDGVKARWHPHLMRPATPDEKDDIRIALLHEADDLEVCPCAPCAPALS